MISILADLTDEDIKWLDQLTAEQSVKPGWADRFHDAMRHKKANQKVEK
jgi:hypothetical protein